MQSQAHSSLQQNLGKRVRSPQALMGYDLDLLDRRGAKRLASDVSSGGSRTSRAPYLTHYLRSPCACPRQALAGDLERLQFLSQPEAFPEAATSLGSVDPMCCSSAEASPTRRAPSCNSTPQPPAGDTPPGRSWVHSTALKSRLSRALTEAQPTSPTDPSLDTDDCNDLRKTTLRRMLMLRAGEADVLPEPQQLHHQLQGAHGHGRGDRSLRRSSRMAQQAETPRAPQGEGRDCMSISPSPAAAPHLQPLC